LKEKGSQHKDAHTAASALLPLFTSLQEQPLGRSLDPLHFVPGALPGHVSGKGFKPFKTGGTVFFDHNLLFVAG
jgi:hypothetical protein